MSKTVLITGSSTGIGRAAAQKFQKEGWNVIATMRSPQNESELNALENVLVERLDVLDLESIKDAVEAGIKRFGKIDVLVNNAGYGAYGPLEAFPRENIERQFNTNVMGLMDVTRAVLPYMRTAKSGLIINISSIGGKMTFPLGSLYHGTKFAVEGISEALNYETSQFGVKVKIVEPGAIATDFGGRSFDFTNDESLSEYQETVQSLYQLMTNAGNNVSPAGLVGDVIYEAATDGTPQIRYTAGADAVEFMKNRKELDDATFIGGVFQQFGLKQ